MSQSELNLVLSVFQSTVILDDDSLVQVQVWDGKEVTIRRKLVDEKMVVVSEVFLIFFYLTPIYGLPRWLSG